MAKLVIEIDPEKIPELMEQLLGNGMVETMEVADVEDDEEAVTAGPTGKSVSDKDWNGSTSAFSDEQYKMAAAVCVEDDTPKSNCFAAETEIITRDGLVPIGSVAGTQQFVLTAPEPSSTLAVPVNRQGHWVEADVQSFGEQPLLSVTLSLFGIKKTIRATANHLWFASQDGRSRKRLAVGKVSTDQLKPGMVLAGLIPERHLSRSNPSPFGVAAGVVFGDGNLLANRGAVVVLCGEKDESLLRYFEGCSLTVEKREGAIIGTRVADLPASFKARPNLNEGHSFLYGWLAGYIAADGSVDESGQVSLYSASRSDLEFVRLVALRLGIATHAVKAYTRQGIDGQPSELHRIRFIRSTVPSSLLIVPEHRRRFDAKEVDDRSQVRWTVESVEDYGEVEETFCATVPETHTFALADYIWVHNCHLPHHNPDGSLNRKGLSAAAAFLDRTDIPAQKKASAAAHLRSHYQKDLEEDPPEAVSAAITAAISDYAPPAEFFGDPKFEAPQRWTTVTSDGRVMGHLALWGECHIGYPNQCITPEMITDGGFDYANGIGHVVSADGEQVGTSPLPIKGGHAPLEWDWKRAKAHYDDPSSVVADVIYGSDEHGIWFSGALRPDATDDKVYAIRASGISGDWRNIDGKLRLLAGCCVNNGGFPKMSARMNLAASGELQSAIAIGGDPEADPTLEEDCGCHETVTADVEVPRLDAIEAKLAKIEGYIRPQIIASLREKLAASE